MRVVKDSGQAIGAKALTELSGFAPPTLLHEAARLVTRQRLVNLVVTNVPGPQFPLYLDGRELTDMFPIVPLGGNLNLGVAVVSYNGALDFGLVGDFVVMHDLEDLADDFRAALLELTAAATGAHAGAAAPWPGYDQQTVPVIAKRLHDAGEDVASAVRSYELEHKHRRGVIDATERPHRSLGAMMRIGVLTGGGDCPGLNAVIRAVVRKGEVEHGDSFVGFRDGWKGLTENLTRPLDVELCRGILPRGGTILGTSRTNPYKVEGGVEAVTDTLKQNEIDALVAIGGDDTLGVAYRLSQAGVHVVGVPKTIDNDLSATEVTFGFHTAVQIATDAIDRLHTTAESHDRIFVCEVMGRHAGWIAMYAGMAGGAAEILIPEKPFDIEEVAAKIKQRHSKGRYASIVVVAEGAVAKEGTLSVASGKVDAFGHAQLGGIGQVVADALEERTGFETRATVLGHIQRGGTPTAYDRVLATRFGLRAIGAVHANAFGTMVALKGDVIDLVPLGEAVTESKTVGPAFLDEAAVFFG